MRTKEEEFYIWLSSEYKSEVTKLEDAWRMGYAAAYTQIKDAVRKYASSPKVYVTSELQELVNIVKDM